MADDVNKNHDMILGEMRGQMREVVHTLNNLSSKFDALTREVVALGPLAVQIAEIKADVAALKAKQNAWGGGKAMGVWIVQTVIAAVAAIGALLAMGRHP